VLLLIDPQIRILNKIFLLFIVVILRHGPEVEIFILRASLRIEILLLS